MNYLIVLAMQFFRWALSWVARELVLLIVTALATNFFIEFRQLFLHFINLIKKRIFTVFDKIESISREVENFDRDERIALALRFAKKDHFRLRK